MGMERTLEEVGQAVARRRVELKLDAAELARLADVDPKTIASLEKGERWPRDKSRASIEEALQWGPGSISDIRAGGSPHVISVLRDRTGRILYRSEATEGAEQEDLEKLRLAAIVMDIRDLVAEQRGPLMTALSALLDEAAELVVKVYATGDDDEDLENARRYILEMRAANTIRRIGNVYVANPKKDNGLAPPIDFALRARSRQRSDVDDVQSVIEASLLNWYSQMHQRAVIDRGTRVMVDQALARLGDAAEPDGFVEPEIADELYVQFLAAAMSAGQGGDPDLLEAVELDTHQNEAARTRYRREFAEMVAFNRLRTVGAPDVASYAAAGLPAAARTTPTGYSKGAAEGSID